MMKPRKLLAIFILAAMIISLLAGCGQAAPAQSEKPAETQSAAEETAVPAEPTASEPDSEPAAEPTTRIIPTCLAVRLRSLQR